MRHGSLEDSGNRWKWRKAGAATFILAAALCALMLAAGGCVVIPL